MAIDITKKKGAPKEFRDDRDGAVLIPHPVIGIVKNNIDPSKNGKIDVYIESYGGIDPDNDKNWIKGLRYMSPYFGSSTPGTDKSTDQKNKQSSKAKDFVGSIHSYGMWAGPPDIGTAVICIFINGRPEMGFYIGAVMPVGSHGMVPAIGATNNVVPNDDEASKYGGAKRLPTTEPDLDDPKVRSSATITQEPKSVHSYQAAIFDSQGLIRDSIRGPIGSSSVRQTNGKIVGMSTSGRAIFAGGYNDKTIEDAIKTGDDSKLQKIGYLGGHSFVMDDGDLQGQDQLIRFRTGGGHQILMSDSGQSIFVIHGNGHSWVELGKEGTVDVYAANSFNVRTVGDINFHADRDINLHAGRNLTMHGKSVRLDSDEGIDLYAAKDFSIQSFGNYNVTISGTLSMNSDGVSNYSAGGNLYVTGKPIYLNTGSGPAPAPVTKVPFFQHKETVYSEKVGWIQPGPNPIVSVTSRCPTHQPWDGANKGVDVSIKQTASSSVTPSSSEVNTANATSPAVPEVPTSEAAVATVGPQSSINVGENAVLDGSSVKAMISQQAASNATKSDEEKTISGIVPGVGGATVKQLEGLVTKPGTAKFIEDKMAAGLSFSEAAGNTLMSGADGAKTAAQFVNNTSAQITTMAKSFDSAAKQLVSKGALSGSKITDAITQPAGIIMATAQKGIAAVTNVLKAPATMISGAIQGVANSAKSMMDTISGGNFAAGLSKLTGGVAAAASSVAGIIGGGISGLASGAAGAITSAVGGALGGLFGGKSKPALGVEALTSQLQSISKQAFGIVENSFAKLKGGQPNNLGGSVAKSLTNSAKQNELEALSNANKERLIAEENLREMKKLSRMGNSINIDQLKEAENLVASATQKELQTASSVLLDTPSELKSGIDAISGGADAFAAQVNNSAHNSINTIKSAVSSITSNTNT